MSEQFAAKLEELVNEAVCDGKDCSCEEFAEHLFELIDAEMPDGEAERLATHAASCPNCTELREAERHLRDLLRKACCEQSAPEELRARIVEQFSFTATADGTRASYTRTETRTEHREF